MTSLISLGILISAVYATVKIAGLSNKREEETNSTNSENTITLKRHDFKDLSGGTFGI